MLNFFFPLRFQKMCLRRERSDFRDFFRPLVPPARGAHRKDTRFQAQNGPQTSKKWIFPVLGAVLDEIPANQI